MSHHGRAAWEGKPRVLRDLRQAKVKGVPAMLGSGDRVDNTCILVGSCAAGYAGVVDNTHWRGGRLLLIANVTIKYGDNGKPKQDDNGHQWE